MLQMIPIPAILTWVIPSIQNEKLSRISSSFSVKTGQLSPCGRKSVKLVWFTKGGHEVPFSMVRPDRMTDAAEVGRRPLLVVVPVAAAASSQNEMLKERTNMLLSKYCLWTSALRFFVQVLLMKSGKGLSLKIHTYEILCFSSLFFLFDIFLQNLTVIGLRISLHNLTQPKEQKEINY